MTKNLKKAVRRLRAGRPITEARFPTNYQRAMDIVYGPELDVMMKKAADGFAKAAGIEPMTEAEFHQEHSVEKEQV